MAEKLSTQEDTAMETSNPSEFQNIIENPGLQNIVERIFLNLNYENLLICRLINKSTRFILDNPLFWLKRWRIQGLSQKNQDDWTRAIQLTKDTELEKNVILYLKKVIKRGISLDIPCYITKCSIERICKTKFQNPETFQSATVFEIFDSKSNLRNMGILQLVAPLMKNSNAPNSSGLTPIHWAAIHGFLCIIEILSPFVMNPNRKDGDGDTPIHSAAMNGHIEVIKFLTSILRSRVKLNVPNVNGDTPIHSAAMNGHIEVIKFLTSILPDGDLKFINVPNCQGETPLQLAKMNGNTKIINFLQNLEEKMELEMLEIPLD